MIFFITFAIVNIITDKRMVNELSMIFTNSEIELFILKKLIPVKVIIANQ